MVKILPLKQLLVNQNIIGGLHKEPVVVSSFGNNPQLGNQFLIVDVSGSIFVYRGLLQENNLQQNYELVSSFTAISSSVLDAKFLPSSDCIVTLEKENQNSAINVCRIYFDWKTLSGEREAIMKQQRQSRTIHGPFQLPAPFSLIAISTCPETPRLVVASKSSISLWNVSASLVEQILEIEIGIQPPISYLALHDSFLSIRSLYSTKFAIITFLKNLVYASRHFVSVLHFSITKNRSTSKLAESEQFEIGNDFFAPVEDEYFVKCVFEDGEFGSSNMEPVVEDPRRAHQKFEILGPLMDSHSITVNKESDYSLTSVTLLLKRQFSDELIHSIQLLPEYSLLSIPSSSNAVSLSSNYNMQCFVSTTRRGYLYDINLKHPNLIATYSYTGETLTSICERYLFTATSDHGLAIWTLRPSDFPEISTFEPCVLGIQQFFGLHSISVTSDFIILLILQFSQEAPVKTPSKTPSFLSMLTSSYAPKNNEKLQPQKIIGWNLYMFQPVDFLSLHKEMISSAKSYRESNPPIYHQLILEDYFLLRSKLSECQKRLLYNKEDASNIIQTAKEHYELFRKNSSLLGDYYLQNSDPSNAALFYSFSDSPISEVVKKLTGQYFISYLETILYDQRLETEIQSLDVKVGNSILKQYSLQCPQRFISTILYSFLTNYDAKEALNLLDNDVKYIVPSFEYQVTRGLLNLTIENYSDSYFDFSSVNEDKLIKFFVKNSSLFDGSFKLGKRNNVHPVVCANILRFCFPWVLLEILLELKLPYETSIQYLKQQQELSGNGLNTVIDDSLLMMCFLEHYISKGIEQSSSFEDKKHLFIDLSKLYFSNIDKLKSKKEFEYLSSKKDVLSQKWIEFHQNLVFDRPSWLDQLPPFHLFQIQKTISTSSVLTDKEIEYLYFRKLQGFLSSSTIPKEYLSEIAQSLISELDHSKEVHIIISLHCFPLIGKLSEGISKLLHTFPKCIVDYSKQFCVNDSDWKLVLQLCLNLISSNKEENSAPFVVAYQNVLSHLAISFTNAQVFFDMLPQNGNFYFFLPFLEQFFARSFQEELQKTAIFIEEES